ncbi:MAG: hypothetical protein H6Q33_3093 [Deltaproteobacteria bacterium]|jgi:hypothetical protein|nr:hypothetical protein [Deltaproteobacteria bacterium]
MRAHVPVISGALAIVLAAAVPVGAKDLTLRYRITTSGVLASTQEFAQYWAGNRIVNDGRGSRALFDLDAETMTMVDKRQKSYYTQTFTELQQQANMMAAEAQRQAERLPPEQRAIRAKSSVSVKPSGKSEKIAGYMAKEYVFEGGGVSGAIWSTEALQAPGGAKARVAFSRMMGVAAPGVYVGQAITQVPGVPLRTTYRTGTGAQALRTTTEVIAVGTQAPAADVITVPEGFARVDSPFDRMNAARKGVGHDPASGVHGTTPAPQ